LGNRHRLNAASRSHLEPVTASISPDGAHVAVSRLNHDGGCVGNTSDDNGSVCVAFERGRYPPLDAYPRQCSSAA
jgi:hypothetical protein